MGGKLAIARTARTRNAEVARLERVRRQQALLLRLATHPALTSGDLEAAARVVTEIAADALEVARASVWILAEGGLTLVDLFERERAHSSGTVLEADRYPAYFAALDTGRAIDAGDARTDPRTCEMADDYLAPLGIGAMLDASIRISGRVVGVVCHEHVGAPRRWRPDELALAADVADQMAFAMLDAQRRAAEAEVRELNARLEQRVAERTAELEAVNRELEAFTYSVSHNLRAPVRHIGAYARILSDEHGGELPQAAHDVLGKIVDATTTMGTLVDDLLALSRMGRSALTPQPVDVETIVREEWNDLVAHLPAAPRIQLSPLPPAYGDPVLLRQVFVVLLDNAIKYSSTRAAPEVWVDSENRDDGIWYRVRDNGVGFDPRFTDRLFGAFERLHDSRDFPGTGVGLALAERIVSRHGGDIRAHSDGTTGATFELRLPVPR